MLGTVFRDQVMRQLMTERHIPICQRINLGPMTRFPILLVESGEIMVIEEEGTCFIESNGVAIGDVEDVDTCR